MTEQEPTPGTLPPFDAKRFQEDLRAFAEQAMLSTPGGASRLLIGTDGKKYSASLEPGVIVWLRQKLTECPGDTRAIINAVGSYVDIMRIVMTEVDTTRTMHWEINILRDLVAELVKAQIYLSKVSRVGDVRDGSHGGPNRGLLDC